MAVHVITGVMGSGKSYEAVSQKILVALRESKVRIVTNIEGLSIPAISAYLKMDEGEVASRLIIVNYDRVTEPGFWYDPENGKTDTVIQPGDLIVLDEVWRYFNRGTKIPEETMRFFRMHRHYVSEETSTSCEIVLINQALRGIHGDIRDVVEVQFQCRKLKSLGFNNTYQVLLREGGSRSVSHRITRKYSKDIFPLYSSYNTSSSNVIETVDSRQSIFSTPFFRYVLPITLILMVFSIYYVYQSVSSGFGGDAEEVDLKVDTTLIKSSESPPRFLTNLHDTSLAWRLVATYRKGPTLIAVMVSGDGTYKTVPIQDYIYTYGDNLGVKAPNNEPGYTYPTEGPNPVSQGSGVVAPPSSIF